MDSNNNLHFKSILSEWTDNCRQWDKGGGRAGDLYRRRGKGREGKGRAYVLKVREGFTPSFNITLHMWQRGGKNGANGAVSRAGDRRETGESRGWWRGTNRKVTHGCKQTTRCDRRASEVEKKLSLLKLPWRSRARNVWVCKGWMEKTNRGEEWM